MDREPISDKLWYQLGSYIGRGILSDDYESDPVWVSARVVFDLTIKVIFQFLDVPVHKTLMRFPQLLECFQQFLCRPRHGSVATALGFDLYHESNVIEQPTASASSCPFFLPRGFLYTKSRKNDRSKNHCPHFSS